MSQWIEVTNLLEPAQDGDLFLSARANPDKAVAPLVALSPLTSPEENKESFKKRGLKFQQDDWPNGHRASRILMYIKSRCMFSASVKIKVWRKYVPRILPGNELYSQPLPLP